ncbi:aminotransferase class V-fold PLP-dependent enzyme, partial [Candidatus Saccharibacteria bacterium]|nr:aminotransferase class V-fold PLP-dependent enzyme [Candidatus Saccharibacteria bacterium]
MIYLDHAAATPVSRKAREAMEPYFSELFFNPSAPYLPAKRVRENYEDAKNRLAHLIGAKGNDLVITSGATEATNLAFTVLDSINQHPLSLTVHTLSSNDLAAESRIPTSTSIPETEFRTLAPVSAPEVLILETEHASVMSTARKYKYNLIKVDKNGRIDLSDLQQKITNRTALISVSLVNNELGTIQPLSEIAEIIKKVRENRLAEHNRTPLYLHSDASQALGLLNINIARLKVDLLTLNSAKVYGPKGVGALYVAHGVKLQPISTGGGQERGLRSGTENVAGLIGFAKAAEEAKRHLDSNRKKYENYRKIFQETLSTSFSKNTT